MTTSTSTRLLRSRLTRTGMVLTALIVAALVWLAMLPTPPASAHCDSVNGPVATAARAALDEGEVKLVLPYVKATQEAELTKAYDETAALRKRGPEVRELADRWFVETAVRLHRVGEGASYTGVKQTTEENPALDAAEASLEAGKADQVIGLLGDQLRADVGKRFQGVLDARAAETANPSVETSRERVEAELMFEKYVVGISSAVAQVAHEEAGSDAHAAHAE